MQLRASFRASWKESAVELFERTTLRLTDDARKLQQSVSWLHRAPANFVKTETAWLRSLDQRPAK